MPSAIIAYVPGSGFVPILSGSPWVGWSGGNQQGGITNNRYPIAGLQLRAHPSNSGNLYISLSGGWVHSGQISTLVGSGGPTINSGVWLPMSGAIGGTVGGTMDGMPLGAGDAYFIPKATFPSSGPVQLCVGCDPACSGGFGRLHWEAL